MFTRTFNTTTMLGLLVVALFTLSLTLLGCGSDATRSDGHTVAVQPKPMPTSTPAPNPIRPETTETQPAVPEPPKEVTYDDAEAAYQAARYEDAVGLFAQYTDRKKANPWGFYMLGLSAWKAGDLDQATAAFDQALRLDPMHAKSWINLSRVHLDADRPEEALPAIERALAIDPESNAAFRVRGRAYHQLGDVDAATKAYRQALVLDDQDAWSMNNLALLYIEAERYDEALSVLARAVELRDDVAIFYNNLGMALEHTGHVQAAHDAYETATTLDTAYEKAATNLARVESITTEPATEPVDLPTMAQRFVDEIERWRSEPITDEQPETAPEPDSTTTTVGEPLTDDSLTIDATDSTLKPKF